MRSLMQDFRYGLRTLMHNRRFAAVIIFTLAVAIGANTAIFSVVNALLLGSLPFRDADRLALAWRTVPAEGGGDPNLSETNPPDYREWRDHNRTFEQMAGYYVGGVNLASEREPERVFSASVTPNLFQVLGVSPLHGRAFQPEEEQYGNHRVAVLSHGLWQRLFNSDPAAIGKKVQVDGEPYLVVGVMPQEFWFPEAPPKVDVWMPMSFEPNSYFDTRKNFFLNVAGRLKPGVSLTQAQADMDSIARRLSEQFKENASSGVKLVPYREHLVGDIRPTLRLLFGAVVLVLLIACANVANMLLARGASREKEIALRAGLGATRGRLIRQLLTESVVLALVSGALGLLLAYIGLEIVKAFIPLDLTRGLEVGINREVLLFTLGLSVLTGIIFGLVPALQASKPNLNEALKEGGRSGGERVRGKARNLLVVAELSLALVLLVAAGLVVKSLWNLQNVALGFESRNTLTMLISLPELEYPEPQQRLNFYRQLMQRVESLPGVQAAGATAAMPLAGGVFAKLFSVEGRPGATSMGEVPTVLYRQITPNYLKGMGMNLLRGRHFGEHDGPESPGVAIVNQALVDKFFPGEDPFEKRVWLGPPETLSTRKYPRLAIVGVVADVRFDSLDMRDQPTIYIPHAQANTEVLGTMYVAVRTAGDPALLTKPVQEQVWSLNRALPVSDVRTLEQRVESSLQKQHFYLFLFGVFGGVALLIATAGVYGLTAYLVSQRTREFGIRMALGAQPRDMFRLIFRQGAPLVTVGVVVGVVAAVALTRAMSGILYEVNPADPLILGLVTAALVGVALLAHYLPARRAMSVDPAVALRER